MCLPDGVGLRSEASLGIKTASSALFRNLSVNSVKKDKVGEYKMPSMEQERIFKDGRDLDIFKCHRMKVSVSFLFIYHLLYSKHCSRHLGYISKQILLPPWGLSSRKRETAMKWIISNIIFSKLWRKFVSET